MSTLLLEHCRRRSSPQVHAFVEDRLYYFQNPKTTTIADLLGTFDRGWRDQFELLIADDAKEAINSIVGLRHKIAHGEPVSVSLDTIRNYRARLTPFVKGICDLVDPVR